MAQLVDEYLLVHRIEPGRDSCIEIGVAFFRQNALVGRERNFQRQLFGKRDVDREDRASFVPLILARTGRPRRSRASINSRLSFSRLCHPFAWPLRELHGNRLSSRVILHGDYGCFGLARFPSRASFTPIVELQRQSGGKIAQSDAANSTVTASCSFALPERTALTCARKRTGKA